MLKSHTTKTLIWDAMEISDSSFLQLLDSGCGDAVGLISKGRDERRAFQLVLEALEGAKSFRLLEPLNQGNRKIIFPKQGKCTLSLA